MLNRWILTTLTFVLLAGVAHGNMPGKMTRVQARAEARKVHGAEVKVAEDTLEAYKKKWQPNGRSKY